MTIQEIKKAHATRPFQPFDLHLADGRVVPVAHPEFLAQSPTGRCVYIGLEDGLEVIDLLLVTGLKIRNGRSTPRRRK